MDSIVLCFRGEPLREFPIERDALEIGSGPFCDIVVHDPEVAERHLLVQKRGASIVAWDLVDGKLTRSRPFHLGEPLPLGRYHALLRIPDAPARPPPSPTRTEPLVAVPDDVPRLALLVGRAGDARRLSVDGRPITLGSGPDNDLVLEDRAVSARHCRIEPGPGVLVVRDLGSRNGTWVEGVRICAARVSAGMTMRIGRTDVRVVARGDKGDARQGGIVAASAEMMRVLGEVERYARLSWPVLVHGESGVGKEGIASALHRRGPRSPGPFVALNAGGLARELVESELFGHERGSFTGAVGVHRGVFEQADGGTLFLDEIGELPLDMQARLLRVLETGEVRRVGAESTSRVDVRVVCATHRDLRAMVERGELRRDLYYRVTRLVIDVPPLRSRPADIEALARHFLDQIAGDVGRRELDTAAIGRLLAYAWPGNARELRNVLCAAAAASAGPRLEEEDVARAIERIAGPAALLELSEERLEGVLAAHGGNLSAAARSLGIARSTLRDRVKGPKSAKPRRVGGEQAA